MSRDATRPERLAAVHAAGIEAANASITLRRAADRLHATGQSSLSTEVDTARTAASRVMRLLQDIADIADPDGDHILPTGDGAQ